MEFSGNKLGDMPIPKLLKTMSLPAILSMMVQALYNIVDSIFVARINENAITALSLAFPVQLIIVALFVGMGIGINSTISRKLGEKNFEEASLIAEHGFLLAGILTVLVLLMGLFLAKPFIKIFVDEPQIIAYGTSYLRIIMIFAFGRIFAQAGMSVLQGSGEMVIPMIAQLIGALTNIILDPILIFGYFGFPPLGVAGAAIATVTAQILSMIFVFLYVFKFKKVVRFDLKTFKFNGGIFKQILKVGLPSSIMQALASVMLVGLNLILAAYSTTAVAVLGIYYRLQSFVFMPVFGLNQGLMPIIGYNYGAKSKKRMLSAIKLATIAAVSYMTLGLIVFQLFPTQLIALFNGTNEMMAIGTVAFRKISLCFPLAAVSIVISTVFQGVGDAYLSMIISFVRQIVVLLPVAFIFSRFFDLDIVWYAFIISEIIGFATAILLFRKTYKNKIVTLA